MSQVSAQELRAERQQREKMMKNAIYENLVISGEKERLKQLLKQNLMECGWNEKLKVYAKQVVREKGSFEELTTDELVSAITPKARDMVPDEIKEQMLHNIRDFIEKNHLVDE